MCKENLMEPIKIAIQNWPSTDYISTIIAISSIAVSIAAVLVSIYSAHLSRATLIASKRSFVWAMSYLWSGESRNNKITPIPYIVALRVLNAPAQIEVLLFQVILNNTILFEHADNDLVMFPSEKSEYSLSISETNFAAIVNKIHDSSNDAFRVVTIKYKAIDGNSKYTYELHQIFDKCDGHWRNFKEKSN
jgi:hypothetical protein